MNKIKIIDDFIESQDIESFISSVDLLYKNQKIEEGFLNRYCKINCEDETVISIVKKYSEKLIKNNPGQFLVEYMPGLSFEGAYQPPHTDMEGETNFSMSAIMYFNEDFEGGEIFFPRIKYEYKPKTGSIVFFDPRIEEDHTHEVKKIIKGRRYFCAMWFSTDKSRQLDL